MQVKFPGVMGEVDSVHVPGHLLPVWQRMVVTHTHILRGKAPTRPHVPSTSQCGPFQLLQLLHPLWGLDLHLADDVPVGGRDTDLLPRRVIHPT